MARTPHVTLRLEEIAVRYGCELHGDPDASVNHVASLAVAGENAIAFLANPAYRGELEGTGAAAVILAADDVPFCKTNCLVAANPHVTFARVAQDLYPDQGGSAGVHPSATIDPSATVADSAQISAGVVIEADAKIGARVFVGPNCVIGAGAQIGDDGYLVGNVSVCHGVRIGERSRLHSGAVVGSDGFGLAKDGANWVKVPQVGTVVVGDDVEIGANACIDRGAIGNTIIGNDVRIDNLVHIAHNCEVGDHTAIAAQTGFAGSTRIGTNCMFGGRTGVNGHIEIGDNVTLLGSSILTRSVGDGGVYSSAMPSEEASVWRRIVARLKRLDKMAKQLKALEKTVAALTAKKDI